MKKIIIAALGLIAFAPAANAGTVGVWGVGQTPCYVVNNLGDSHDSTGLKPYADWGMGFWSGLNAMELENSPAAMTGANVTTYQIGLAIDQECRANPTWSYGLAIEAVYKAIRGW
jgi:hypothetical protein